jgi:hypothetical protein
MGGLIQTRGTKRLAAHYYYEFDTYIEFYRQSSVITYFIRNGSHLNVWDDIIQNIRNDNTTDPLGDFPDHTDRGDKLCLIPGDKKSHKNLLRRWKLYLKKVLPPTQHDQLIDAIYTALSDDTYGYIVFDVVQAKGYAITPTDNLDSDGNKFMMIVLETVELPVDPGYGPSFIRDSRPV